MKQLAITNPRCIGDGDLVLDVKHILISDEDLKFIKDSCENIYKLNKGNLDDIRLDEWSKMTYFSDIYDFFIKNELTPCATSEDEPFMKWDKKSTVKNTFRRSELCRLLKIWSMGYKDVRTCWGNEDDSIAEYPSYFAKKYERIERYIVTCTINGEKRYYDDIYDEFSKNFRDANHYFSKKEAREKVNSINKWAWSKAHMQTIRKGIDF